MKKIDAINLLGGSIASTATAIGITRQAVSMWPDELPATISDRVEAAYHRLKKRHIPEPKEVAK